MNTIGPLSAQSVIFTALLQVIEVGAEVRGSVPKVEAAKDGTPASSSSRTVQWRRPLPRCRAPLRSRERGALAPARERRHPRFAFGAQATGTRSSTATLPRAARTRSVRERRAVRQLADGGIGRGRRASLIYHRPRRCPPRVSSPTMFATSVMAREGSPARPGRWPASPRRSPTSIPSPT